MLSTLTPASTNSPGTDCRWDYIPLHLYLTRIRRRLSEQPQQGTKLSDGTPAVGTNFHCDEKPPLTRPAVARQAFVVFFDEFVLRLHAIYTGAEQ
jgi:hypothetical protein